MVHPSAIYSLNLAVAIRKQLIEELFEEVSTAHDDGHPMFNSREDAAAVADWLIEQGWVVDKPEHDFELKKLGQ